MAERPILFSGPMVRAILEGRKPQPRLFEIDDKGTPCQVGVIHVQGRAYNQLTLGNVIPSEPRLHSVGDTLWVRENWYCDDYRVQRGPYLKPDDMDLDQAREDGVLVYAADGLCPYEQEQPTWKPSIHMPRWASRISLSVTGVKVERLRDISEADAIAEGAHKLRSGRYVTSAGEQYISGASHTAIEWFSGLWTSINGAASWEANPWVVAYSFQRIKP